MLISSWFLSVALLLVPCALCSDEKDDKVNEKTPKQLQAETDRDVYKYNHPPLPETTVVTRSRKEKSVNLDEQSTSKPIRSRSRGTRRGTSPKPTTETELKIPVEVIYETTTTRPRSTTTPSVERNTRIVKRKRLQPSNTDKKIDIRDTTISSILVPSTEKVEVTQRTIKDNTSSVTEFPKRSRDSYFKKRTGPPAPKVKILEEKNFVYSHSGNFHYSFLGGDGTKVSSQGELRSYANNKTGEAVSGNVFYTDKDGNDFSLSYTADENGYRPVGAHLPTPPPLPPAIVAALKYIAEKSTTTAPETKHDN